MRYEDENPDWPLRPWIMAAIGAAGGLAIHLLTDDYPLDIWRQLASSFVGVAVLSLLLTVERQRWTWSAAFALGWGLIIAFVGWFTASYNRQGNLFEFPFWSGLLAVMIAAPLFQTVRDEGAWRFPYARVHRHVWLDAVIGAASLAFVGLSFLLLLVIGGLFRVIGIDLIENLFDEEWFLWMFAGLAFGGAVGLLRDRDALAATLQRLATVALTVLAPVLAVALVVFLVSVPFQGLSGLWDSDVPATPILLLSAAGAFILANSVIGDGKKDRSISRVANMAALALTLSILPLALLAALSMGQRIGQYGWTPERIWGVIAVGVAVIYGAIGWWSAIRRRAGFDDLLRPLQIRLALGLCGLALLLALPIFDFGAVSARSQVARLESGKVTPEEFDWTAMAFDFGPAGRNRLREISQDRSKEHRQLARTALDSEDRYDLREAAQVAIHAPKVEANLRVLSEGIVLSPGLTEALAREQCGTYRCALMRLNDGRGLLVISRPEGFVFSKLVQLEPSADGQTPAGVDLAIVRSTPTVRNLDAARIEVRQVARQQLYVDGKPVDAPFE